MRWTRRCACFAVFVAAMLTIVSSESSGQSLAWDAAKYFQYNIEQVRLDKNISPYTVKIIFSVSDPTGQKGSVKDRSKRIFWNIKDDAPFKATSSRVGLDVGWDTSVFVNTGAVNETLTPIVPQGKGAGAALPIQVNAIANSQACTASDCPGIDTAGRYFVTTTLPYQAMRTGRVAMEGHPVWPVNVNGTLELQNVPVKSSFKDFAITDTNAVPRRQIVGIEKCKACHTGTSHDGRIIPRLSLHGGNRTEEPGVCVICHNPNQTDIPYRTAGKEESVDFQRMVHGIHAASRRENSLVIIGRNGSVNDFSYVRFPGELKNCFNCHLEIDGKGTFELPLKTVHGVTVDTRSVLGTSTTAGYADVDPSNDLKITPTAAVCSACHDKSEDRSHMRSGGASFATLQSRIADGSVKERCVDCHGAGKEKDIRRVHVGGDD